MFAFGYFPEEALTADWFPVIVGSVAFAGPSGMQQMWYTLHLRESGAGMGAHIPQTRGLAHAGEEEEMPSRGFMFDTDDPAEMAKWRGWRRWVTFDALLLFWGITMLVTISFTVLAQAAARQSPDVVGLLREGEREAALRGHVRLVRLRRRAGVGRRVPRVHRADRAERHTRPVRLVLPRPVRHDLQLRPRRQTVPACRTSTPGSSGV